MEINIPVIETAEATSFENRGEGFGRRKPVLVRVRELNDADVLARATE